MKITAAELFSEFQAAQQTKGDFAYFSLLFFVRGIGAGQHINSSFPGNMTSSLLTASLDRDDVPRHHRHSHTQGVTGQASPVYQTLFGR